MLDRTNPPGLQRWGAHLYGGVGLATVGGACVVVHGLLDALCQGVPGVRLSHVSNLQQVEGLLDCLPMHAAHVVADDWPRHLCELLCADLLHKR